MAVAGLPLRLLEKAPLGLVADNEEERFDIVDDDNQIIGQEKRSVVHATGLKHRAVYCFVFDEQGRLLMQQRSPRKKIGPLQWDLSVAEHLQPGESYREVVTLCQSHRANAQLTHGRHPPQPWHIPAASRGLHEELGISAAATTLIGPLVPAHLRRLHVPEVGVTDCEFVTSFRLDKWQGEVIADPAEVHAWKFAEIPHIQADMEWHPDEYTPWFRAEVHAIAEKEQGRH